MTENTFLWRQDANDSHLMAPASEAASNSAFFGSRQ